MSIVITGASGKLGRLAVEALLRRGVPAGDLVATGRSVERLADLADRGVGVRRADYDDPASLRQALAGAERLLFVSGSEVGRRDAQHAAVVAAAQEAGVGLVAYTSIVHADTSSLVLAQEHRDTEKALAASGVPHVLLRNSWYLENYTEQLPVYLQHGIAGSAGSGRISAATRADYAEAAAAALTGEGHEGRVYELGGPSFTLAELADAVSAATGSTVTYTDLPVEHYTRVLVAAGVPEAFAAVLADSDRGAAQGELAVDTDHLEQLLGRPATTLAEALAAGVRAARG